MVSPTSIFALVAAVATTIDYVQGHGYIANPAPSWKGKKTNDWVVEIPPVWDGPWDETKGDEGLLSTFKELAAKNNFKDLRTLMDGNPVFGEDCGFTDPKGTPVDPPSDGTATFSRGIVHAGRCEIWLDDKLVLKNDDCQSAYGDGTQKTIAILKPIDYSSCPKKGCLLRFYWLAMQRRDGKVVFQAYKNCIPLTGPGKGGGGDYSKKDGGYPDSDQDVTQSSPTPGDDKKSSESPSSDTPYVTPVPAPSSKCKGARRRD